MQKKLLLIIFASLMLILTIRELVIFNEPIISEDSDAVLAVINNETSQERYQFLNEGLEYGFGPKEGDILFQDLPAGTFVGFVWTKEGSYLEEMFGSFGQGYWMHGTPTIEMLQLIEYHLLTRIAVRENLIPIYVLSNFMSEDAILRLGERLHHGWALLRQMDYPKEVEAIHNQLLEVTESVGPFLSGIPNATMTYRALDRSGPGGFRGYGYNSYESSNLIYQATLELNRLLDESGVEPY